MGGNSLKEEKYSIKMCDYQHSLYPSHFLGDWRFLSFLLFTFTLFHISIFQVTAKVSR